MDEMELNQMEPELPEFSLDDIMKEFASEPDEALPQEILEEIEEELPKEKASFAKAVAEELGEEETLVVAEPEVPEEEPEAELPAEEEVTGDTIRLDRLQINAAKAAQDAVPIADEEEEPVKEYNATKEGFTEQWEPEYEQPMGNYVPPQPILIHPRSRLRELKRKLVAGPERRYYELSEKGVGKLQASIFLSVLIVVLCAGATIMYALGSVQEDRLRLMIFGQFFAMLVSALLGSYQFIEGVSDVIKGRFTVKTLLVITFIVCCLDAVLCLRELRVPCCAAFSLQMTFAIGNTYQRRSAEMGQMDAMRKAVRLDGIRVCDDYYEGKKGFLRGEGEVEDFMDRYNTVSGPEKVLSWYALMVWAGAMALGVVAGVFYGVSAGAQVAAVTLLAATPASIFVTLSRPQAILVKRLHSVGAVICGWSGVKALCGKAVFPMDYHDLFPAGSARMNGVKFYGSRQPDEIVAYCTAVVTANNSGLAPLFTQVLDSRNGRHYDAENLVCYENGGIGGEVQGEPVLVGMLPFLKEMGVAVPEGIRVNQAVCVAIDGELCGLFALSYENNRSAAVGLNALCGSRKLRPIIATDDFLLNSQFIRSRFNVNPKWILQPDTETKVQLQEKQVEEGTPSAVLVTRNSLAAFALSITGARSLKTASVLGVVVHMLGGVLGIAAMATLLFLGRLDLLTPANMFAYQLVWMIPGLLFTEWTRTG